MSLSADFVAELRPHFAGELRTDLASHVLYSTDASIYQIEPLGVALPRNLDDLSAVVELASKYNVPLLPRGAGSSLAGQAIGNALILDCSRYLDKIVSIDPQAATATVEPGVVLATLNRAAAKFGLRFGPDPASAERATMGGVIANNATGAHSILYGMAADHLLSSEVVLADGSLATLGEVRDDERPSGQSRMAQLHGAALDIRREYADVIKAHWPKTWRNSAGYRLNYLLPWSAAQPPRWSGEHYPPATLSTFNLASLLAGSEGTLAVIRTATVRLVPQPRHTLLAVIAYPSVVAACEDVPDVLRQAPSAVELIPQMLIRLARSVPAYAGQLGFVEGDPAALLVVEFSGEEPSTLEAQARGLRRELRIVKTIQEQNQIWNIRKVGLGLLDSRPASARTVAFIEDCAIPVERLGEFVREVQRILDAHGTTAAFYAHASAGTLHIRPILDLKTQSGTVALRTIAQQVLALTLQVGGAMSSEHGDGLARSEWLKQTYGESLLEAFKRLKRAADPQSILNPDKLMDAPPMDTHLRYGAAYQARIWTPQTDFGRRGGLAQAIEQCNGQGVCRKQDGVMCPSFQATREEAYSTRGRANLLRALISRSLSQPETEVMTEAVYQALDLCLACKGCTSECPSGVDMPRLKFEFMDRYYEAHRRPLRDYLFGYFHVLTALAGPMALLVNGTMQISAFRRLLAKAFQISPQRPFPRFSRRRAQVKRSAGARPIVLFLNDPFTHTIEPQVEQAAFDLLHLAGFDVRRLPVSGAGASLLSKGLIAAAQRHAAHVLDAAARVDPEFSLPVVGIEPSEVYTFKHEYHDLLPQRADETARRAANAWLLEEFFVRSGVLARWQSLGLEQGVLNFHPHCHQRAEGPAADGLPNGVEASVALLQACGYHVTVLQTGCCGMAGTFGYEAEHYELSMQIGALRLFPQVKAARAVPLAASGAACRMQIEQGADVATEHPLVLAARALQAATDAQP